MDAANEHLKSLTDEQRKAVFFKVTHDGPVELTGTGLKPLVDRSRDVTFAVPTSDNLDSFAAKVQQFAISAPKNGLVENQSFANIEDVSPGEPKDRLSDEFFTKYDSLTKQDLVICEIEMLAPLDRGVNQRRTTIAELLRDLKNAFASGMHGTLFEHEEGDGICRAVIRCTGKMFQQLVEDEEWQRKISWFEPKPQFETFHTIWNDFAFEKLAPIGSPPTDAPVVCIVDSGVTSGNPFLRPVTKDELLKSFLKHDPDNPFDENGHGSGVASLAAYHVINIDEGAANTPKIWIAGARILGKDCQIEEQRLLSKVIEEVVATFVPLGVRIFNLSVGDLAKKWNQDSKRTQPRTSWTARTLDRLSRQHDIVFVVSAGNILLNPIRDFLQDGIPYPVYLCDPESRILDPGQAALAVTVGSISAGTLVVSSPDTAIALDFEPSPFTRSGPGIKGEIKPDLVEVGGNLVTDVNFTGVRRNPGTNVVMASHQLTPAAAHNYGTSFSAPRVANKLAVLLHELKQFGLDYVSALY
ncbi:MAG: S8 family peptidase [Pirellulaceae bacterium]